jgi:hypothetical protein
MIQTRRRRMERWMTTDDDDSEQGVTPRVKLAHPANRSLLAVVSDLLVDSVEHQRHLKDLCVAIRDSLKPVGVGLIGSLAAEIRRDGQQRVARADEVELLIENGE